MSANIDVEKILQKARERQARVQKKTSELSEPSRKWLGPLLPFLRNTCSILVGTTHHELIHAQVIRQFQGRCPEPVAES